MDQSLYKLDKKYFENFGCVIGDEAHLFKSKSLTTIMTKLINCKYRFGLTGTLDGTQTHRLVLEGLFGKVNKVTTTKELIDKDTLANLKIKCLVLKHKEEDCKQVKDLKYSDEIQYIVSHKTRNDFISRLCDKLSGNTLCLYQLVEKHGVILYDLMKDFDRKVFFIHGGTDTETREKIRAITEKETMQSLSHRMVHFLLVLTLGTCIMSCSHLRLNLEYELINQSGDDFAEIR